MLLLWLSLIVIPLYAFDLYKSRLAVDYGPRLVGIATSLGSNITPLRTLQNHGNLTLLAAEIINLARAQGAVEILVGIPVDKDGRMKYTIQNFNGILCLNFSSVLAAVCARGFPKASVLIIDERYTTREAKEKSKNEYPRATLDAVSAACILERYLEDEGSFNVLPALPCPYPPPYDLEAFDYGLVQNHIRMAKYSADDYDASNENARSRKFGIGGFTGRSYTREVGEYKLYSFNAQEYVRMKAAKTAELACAALAEEMQDETEAKEESEEERQFRIRAARRKRGTLKRPNTGGPA